MLWLPWPVKGPLGTHWIEGRVGLMSGLDPVDKNSAHHLIPPYGLIPISTELFFELPPI